MPKFTITLDLFKILSALCMGIAFAAALVAMSAQSAQAQGTSFRDDFNSFNSDRWLKSDHVMERTDFDPDNVTVDNGYLRLKVHAHKIDDEVIPDEDKVITDGAEIESRDYYGYGTFRTRMRVADAPSAITGFFLYSGTDPFSEIDIEVYNDGTGKVDFVTYADGQKTNTVSKDFRFDPSVDFHNYRIDYNPGSVQFYIDGNLRQTWTEGVPSTSMKLLVNTWFPDWLAGQTPETARATRIDWITYEPG